MITPSWVPFSSMKLRSSNAPLFSISLLLLFSPAQAYIASDAIAATEDGNRSEGDVFPSGIPANQAGQGLFQGEPVTFTWSIVPDGTRFFTGPSVSNFPRISDVITFWDASFNVPAAQQTADLTNRVWFRGLHDGLDLITKRCGVTYIYEPVDDGADCFLSPSFNGNEADPGAAGVRGDLRFAGDTTLFAGGLSSIACGELNHPEIYMNIASFDTESALRFVMCHEAMHALGFSHSSVNNSGNQSAVTGSGGTSNGPQFDDICGLHRKYGDVFEKNGGNDTLPTATNLGSVALGGSVIIGDDADDTVVAINEFDFISIDGATDTDFLKFTLPVAQEVTITLDPRGPTYDNFPTDVTTAFRPNHTFTIQADSLNDLSFNLYNASGNLIQSVSNTGLGGDESLIITLPAGDYYAEITGNTPDPTFATTSFQYWGTQMYAFSVESNAIAPVASNLELSTPLNTSIPITLSATDGNGDPLTYNISSPLNGTLSGTAPSLTYTPNPGFCGSEVLTYTANDGLLNSNTASVTVFIGPREILAGYDFDDGTGSPTTAPTVTGNNTTASAFSVGSGLLSPPSIIQGGSALTENTDAEGNILGTANPLSYGGLRDANIGFTRLGDLDDALSTGDYLSFTVTPTSGNALHLLNFTFRTWINNFTESVNSWSLYSSIDGFTTSIADGQTTTLQTWVGHQVSLLRPEFQSLTTPVEFRLYIYNGRNNGGSLTLFDKIALNGTSKPLQNGYPEYISQYPNLSDPSFSADPDGDGIPNGIEYLLGSNASVHDCSLPEMTFSGSGLLFNFNRNAASTLDTTQVFQYGTDLINWTDVSLTPPVSPQVTIGSPAGGLEPISITIGNAQDEVFWRLKVDQ